MPRSMLAGMTDYRHQSFEDMVSDLGKWVDGLEEVINIIKENINKLEETGYWDKVSYDFKATVYYSLKFYETSVKEIKDILLKFDKEVRKDHVVRIKRLFKVASELNKDFGIAWHQHYDKKEYGEDEFKLVEKIYQEGRDMAADMLDLSNLAERLGDFVGGRGLNDKEVAKRFPWLTLNPNFYGIGVNLKVIFKKWFKGGSD